MPQPTASRIAVGLAALLLAASGLASCDGDKPAKPAVVPATTAARPPRPVTLDDAKRCPVTRPRRVGPPEVSPDDFFGWGSSHGNGKLWVGGLWPRGVTHAGPELVAQDGSVGMKFGCCGWPPAGCSSPAGGWTALLRRREPMSRTATATAAFRPAASTSPPRAAGRLSGRCPRPA